jgi:hypothetical protein
MVCFTARPSPAIAFYNDVWPSETLMPYRALGRPCPRFTVPDLIRVCSGPTCVRQLADWGATQNKTANSYIIEIVI